MKNKINVFFALVITIMTIPSCSNAQKGTNSETIAKNVSVEEFKKLVEANPKGQIIDVRTPGEYAQGNLKGSTLMTIGGEGFNSQLEKLDKKAPVYVYCKSGGRSGRAMGIMQKMGFTEVYNMNGGMMAWQRASYPTKE